MGYNKTNVEANTYYPEEVNHNYNRAPTEESIKLAREYEEIIHKQVEEKFFAKNNLFNYTLVFSRDYLTQDPVYYLKICINGQEFSETFRLNQYGDTDPDRLIERFNQWMCSKILHNPIRDSMLAFALGGQTSYKVIDGQLEHKGKY